MAELGKIGAVNTKSVDGLFYDRRLMARVFDLDLTLHGSAPRVWRRVRIPGDRSLADLHRVIQVVMRWDDVHPHVFDVDGREYGPEPDEEEISLHWAADDADITVAKAAKKDASFEYTYDFGREQRVDVNVVGEQTGLRAHIECLAGEGDNFDLDDTNARLVEEFRAGRVDDLVADLTLLLLYLESWEEGRGSRSANKTMKVEILESLANAGFVVTNVHRKSLNLTDAGVKRAEDLLRRVTPLLRT